MKYKVVYLGTARYYSNITQVKKALRLLVRGSVMLYKGHSYKDVEFGVYDSFNPQIDANITAVEE